ncbi:hypothetical protein HMPREF9089_00879 [Eubacterium brachy ATCC 33089]|nr:hypothetical protein HMPREF9089_00879 [Eubacterium brachy ATCC 33089]
MWKSGKPKGLLLFLRTETELSTNEKSTTNIKRYLTRGLGGKMLR